jgi:hypothetical protein
VVLDNEGPGPGIITEMRDIVRCWLTEGAMCDVTPESATA